MNFKKPVLLMMALIVSVILVNTSMFAAFAADMPSPSWRTKASMPTARGQTSIITGDDGLIYVMGGYNGTTTFNKTEVYNPATNTWTTKADLPQVTRGAAVAKGLDGIIYVIGGFFGGSLRTVQAYNTTSDTWTTKTDLPFGEWIAGAATGPDGKIYVIGGEGSPTKTQIYDPSANMWTAGLDMPTGRSLLGVVGGPDGLIYAIGGYAAGALATVQAYNPATNTWSTKASLPYPRLEFGLTLGLDGNIYVIGGGTSYYNNAGPVFDTVQIYDHFTDTWTVLVSSESCMPTARKELSAAQDANGRFYLIGGSNGTQYININEQATIENSVPTAYVDSISPNPATRGQAISLTGHGTDSDGSIAAYKWRSSLDGTIGTSASISVSTLTVGTHTIYFSVGDDSGAWSNEAVAMVTVNRPITEDPTYQQLVDTNQQLVDTNQTLNNQIADLTQKLDTTTLMLLATNIVVIVLVIITIAVVFMSRRKPVVAVA